VQKPGKLPALATAPSTVAGAVTMEKITEYKDASR
jgi:methionine sulfoxide reductase catalytic subunit